MESDVQIERYILVLKRQLLQAREHKDQQSICTTLFGLALCYVRLENFFDAHVTFDELIGVTRALHDQENEKIALMGDANALTDLHRYHDAFPLWKAALRLSRDREDREAESEILSNLGFTYMQADLPGEALPFLQEALSHIRALGERHVEANTLNTLGIAYSKLGRSSEALHTYEEALSIAREMKNKEDQAFQLGNIGHEYCDHLGLPEQGAKYFKLALAIFREIAKSSLEGQTLYNLGKAYLLAGNYDAAEQTLRRGRQVLEAIGEKEMLARVLGALSEVLAKKGRVDDAVGYYHLGRNLVDPKVALFHHQEASRHAHEQGDIRAEAFHLGELATALGVLERHAEALARNLETIPLYRQLGDQHGEAICFVNIGTICFFADRYAECKACWRRGLDLIGGKGLAEEEIIYQKLEQVERVVSPYELQLIERDWETFYQLLQSKNLDLLSLFAPLISVLQQQEVFLTEWADDTGTGREVPQEAGEKIHLISFIQKNNRSRKRRTRKHPSSNI